jgi:hypothetical protein
MPGAYWWECEKCSKQFDFKSSKCGSEGIAHFIQDYLRKNWDQNLLIQECPECKILSLRIAYEFPKKKDKLSFRVYNIVGIDYDNGAYIPMMWATKELPYNEEILYDFKYISGRKNFGLSKAAIFSQEDLKKLFRLYCEKTGAELFP